jgi:hypothetical protein
VVFRLSFALRQPDARFCPFVRILREHIVDPGLILPSSAREVLELVQVKNKKSKKQLKLLLNLSDWKGSSLGQKAAFKNRRWYARQ